MTVKLGVPSKGRLMEKTFDWFGARGITLTRTGSDREYAGAVEGVAGVSLILLSAGEIPRELAAGRIHLGVTGTDLIHEKLALHDQLVTPLAELGFGHADLIIAVPQGWTDVDTMDDLDAVAAQFRTHHNMRLRIATKPKAPWPMKPPRPLPTSPQPGIRCAPTTSRYWPTGWCCNRRRPCGAARPLRWRMRMRRPCKMCWKCWSDAALFDPV